MQQDRNEKPGHFLHLEDALSFEDIGSDKIDGFRCFPSMRNGQKVTSAAQAEDQNNAYRRPEGLLHPVRDAVSLTACGNARSRLA